MAEVYKHHILSLVLRVLGDLGSCMTLSARQLRTALSVERDMYFSQPSEHDEQTQKGMYLTQPWNVTTQICHML